MNGLCPFCKKVIPSDSRRCPHCGTVLKMSLFSDSDFRKEVAKETRSTSPGLYWGQTILGCIGAILLLFVNIWLGLIVCAIGFCLIPAWSRAMLRTALEKAYLESPEREKAKSHSSIANKSIADKPIVPQTDYTEELKKLKELLDSGVLTQEEFDAKKKQLLRM